MRKPVALGALILLCGAVATLCYWNSERGITRTAANEADAIRMLEKIRKSEDQFSGSHNGNYSLSPSELDSSGLEYSGYKFDYHPYTEDHGSQVRKYKILASPINLGKTGTRYFESDETGQIRYELMRLPDSQSPRL